MVRGQCLENTNCLNCEDNESVLDLVVAPTRDEKSMPAP